MPLIKFQEQLQMQASNIPNTIFLQTQASNIPNKKLLTSAFKTSNLLQSFYCTSAQTLLLKSVN